MSVSRITVFFNDRLIRQVENYLDAAKVKGFPIVVDDETRILIGYIGSQHLRRAIGELRFSCLFLVVA